MKDWGLYGLWFVGIAGCIQLSAFFIIDPMVKKKKKESYKFNKLGVGYTIFNLVFLAVFTILLLSGFFVLE